MKGEALRFESVGALLAASSLRRPLEADFGREIQDQRQVRPGRPDGQSLESGDELGRQVPRRALIGPGRVREPVGNDPGAARERREDRLFQVVDAGGGEQERLPGGTEVGGKPREDRLAQRLCAGRAAGLAGANHIKARAP